MRALLPLLALALLTTTACRQVRVVPPAPLVAGIIPGCPATEAGAPSECSWRRAIWAAEVWEQGGVDVLIASGAAVHNRYIEAEVMKAALVALGVPEDRVVTETQALHTDENVSYSLDVADALGVHRLVGISEQGQATGVCQMALMWGWSCDPAPMKMKRVRQRLQSALPDVSVQPVPEERWQHWAERERALRRSRGQKPRPASATVYFQHFVVGIFGGTLDKPEPPQPEPTLLRAPGWANHLDGPRG
ncbi:MAG: YdcF family protein [Deltaproteobacteria bacterium]|nr:YdcF family protein [Deltaproteobacteria bacterium]